jgi:two-component system response regulator AtoC
MTVQRVLVVDDEPLGREYLTEAVESLGYSAFAARDAAAALVLIEREQPDVVITDLRMPGDRTGVERLRQEIARSVGPTCRP